MTRPQLIGMLFAVAAAGVGTIGLLNTERLPPSARLGAMAKLDGDGDGRVSLAEWTAAGRNQAAFIELDRDGSGLLEPTEAKARRGARSRK